MLDKSSVVLAHHWLTGIRGGEKVLEQFCKLFPQANIETLVAKTGEMPEWLQQHRIGTSILQKFPKGVERFKTLLPFFPFAIGLTMKAHEKAGLVLSTDASLIKGLRVPDDAIHVCYCHSPPRYLWDLQETYLAQSSELNPVSKLLFRCITPYLKNFDIKASQRVDHFIANSHFVAARIKRCYGRESKVIYPPVATQDFKYTETKDDFYLVVSELVPYKRIDLAVDAFNRNGKRLVVIGNGSERSRLEKRAKSNITFLGRQPFDVLVDHYARAKAFIFPGIEDFGITPLEAQASGTPVIAFGKGGALETVINKKTGTFFYQQTAESLNRGIKRFETEDTIDPRDCRSNALLFGEQRFRDEIMQHLRSCCVAQSSTIFVEEFYPELQLAG